MRTTKSTVTFRKAFVLNADSGELPAGRYDIEIDEDEISTVERAAFRRTAVYVYVEDPEVAANQSAEDRVSISFNYHWH